MPALVLESEFGSQYEDAPDSYEFQSRYLKFFSAVGSSEPVHAVIYEPRGAGAGRMGYVALAEIITVPVPTGRRNRAGEGLWRVSYRRPAVPFDVVVPREVLGEPVERWLGDRTRGRARNVATYGRAVRPLTDNDFESILRMGSADPLVDDKIVAVDSIEPLVAIRERLERIIHIYERRAAFRREVLGAYEYRCAVTGVGIGAVARTKSMGLLDAAHIRPIEASGVDSIRNGIALTPTVHRLFDQGLFALRYAGEALEVVTSPRLDDRMVEVPERGVSFAIRAGTRILTPSNPALRPRAADIDYHRRRVFLGS